MREIALLKSQTKFNILPLKILMKFRVLAILSIQFRDPSKASTISIADISIYFSFIMINSLLHYLNLTFLILGIVDFRRKLFYKRMMSIIIDPNIRDNELIESHFLTNVKFHRNKQSNEMVRFRIACLDFGKKYTIRIFIYCSVFLAFYGVTGLTLFFTYIGLLPYKIPIDVYIIGYYDVTIIRAILFIMIRTGAQINEYYSIHKGILMRHKENLWKIYKKFNGYRGEKIFENNSLKVIKNQIKAKMLTPDKRKDFTEDIITTIDIVIEKLDYDSEKSCSVIGLDWTFALISPIYATAISFTIGIAQYLYIRYFT